MALNEDVTKAGDTATDANTIRGQNDRRTAIQIDSRGVEIRFWIYGASISENAINEYDSQRWR